VGGAQKAVSLWVKVQNTKNAIFLVKGLNRRVYIIPNKEKT